MKRSLLKSVFAALMAASLLIISSNARAQTASIPIAVLPQNARLAVCGDSITEEMIYTKYIEIYLRACTGRNDVSCFQFGWGGENADQFRNRINRGDLDAFIPTHVTFLYGANDIADMAWDEAWMPSMWNGRVGNILVALQDKYPGILPNTVICSPTFLDTNSPNASAARFTVTNDSLGHLRDICRTIAVANEMGFSDVRTRMLNSGTAARAALGEGYYFGGSDGAHSGPNGQFMMAHEILKSLNCDGAIATISVNLTGAATASAGHTIVSSSGGQVVVDSSRYPFCYNYNGSTAADRIATILPFLPFSQELNRFMLVVTNLGQPYANVTWGDTTLTFTSEQLSAGVNLADKFHHTPFDSKFASIMALIETKELKERSMIKAAGDATASTKGWTDADVTERNAMDTEVKNAIVPVRHTLTIVPVSGGAAPAITGNASAAGTVGAAFSFQIAAANNPTSYSAEGLPAGLTINSTTGEISGTPTASGTSTVTLSAINAFGTGTATLTLTISQATLTPVITSAATANGTAGTAFSYQITATNNPNKFYATGLPSGLGVNSTSGAITGIPTTAGTTNVLISAENTGGNGTAITLVITISPVGSHPAGPQGYTWCADENATFTLSGTCDVAYGANGSFVYLYSQTGSITFNNVTFGSDPIFGVAKSGFYKTSGTAPATPASLMATAGNAQISLNWSASSGATNYNVYRGTSAGGESATAIASGITTTSFTDTGLSNGTAYFYKVTAINLSGTSGYSNEASASPRTPYTAWRNTYFTPEQLANPAISDDTASPAGDGISNLMKYALGLNPNIAYSGTSEKIPYLGVTTSGSNQYMSLTFTGEASDVTYNIQATSDLMDWTTIYSSPAEEAPGLVVVSDTVSMSYASQRFMRLQITSSTGD